jgi:hypothetical protein
VAPPGAPGAPLNADGSANTNAPKEQADLDAKSQQNALQGQQQIGKPSSMPALPTKPSREGEITPPGGSTSGSSNAASEAARALAIHRHSKGKTPSQVVDTQKDAVPDVRELAGSEIRAYRNWLGKGAHNRSFEFTSTEMLVRIMAPDLEFDNATFKHAADANAHAIRHDVHALMSESFPPEAIEWVKHTDWTGPQKLNPDHIDMHDKNSWAAWHDHAKVEKIAKKLRNGKKSKPGIYIKVKGKNRFICVDGHHHLLGSLKAGVIPVGYVGEIDPQYLTPALETHTEQFPKNDKSAAVNYIRNSPSVPDFVKALFEGEADESVR